MAGVLAMAKLLYKQIVVFNDLQKVFFACEREWVCHVFSFSAWLNNQAVQNASKALGDWLRKNTCLHSGVSLRPAMCVCSRSSCSAPV